MLIAIDGPSAAGKGTLARKLARHFGYAHLDSGALYRALALALRREGLAGVEETAAEKAANSLDLGLLDDPAIRRQEIGEMASEIAAWPRVRRALNRLQRKFGTHPPGGAPGAVIDGRDIGTVVFPDADIKLFVTASVEERARRRQEELRARGEERNPREILFEIRARDRRDRERETAPLKKAEDALLLDTTKLDIEAAFRAALELIEARREDLRDG